MSRHVAAYRRLVRLYPAGFRAKYGEEMTRLFADQLRDASGGGTTRGLARLWAATIADLVITIPAEHIRREEPMQRPAEGPAVILAARPSPPLPVRVVFGLLPLGVLLFLVVVAPGFLEPLLDSSVSIAGIVLGPLLVAVTMAWMALGLLAMRAWRSPLGALAAFALFAVPAAVSVVLSPSLILVVANLVLQS